MADVLTTEKRSNIMRSIKSKNTGIEIAARKMFGKHGIKYRSHPKLYGSPDFMLEGRLILFCDGSFWHGRDWKNLKERLSSGNNPNYWVRHIETNRKRDRKVNKALKERGYTVLRLWDTDIQKRPMWCVARIRRALEPSQPVNG